MADTNAARQRRYRRHKVGDHSLCRPGCMSAPREAAPKAVDRTPETARPPVAAVLEPAGPSRGEQLCAALCEDDSLGPAERVLAEEAGRLADRLDRLHAHLADWEWLSFQVADYSTEKTTTVVVKLDRVLAETRQQQEVLKSLVSELRQAAIAAGRGKQQTLAPRQGGAGLADLIDLAARR